MSIYQDISSSNTQIHLCTVERVYNSGLIDARSFRDVFFEQINTTFFGAEGNYTVGSNCVVISDGSQHFSLGQINLPQLGDDGSDTVRNVKNDLADLTDAQSLVAGNNFGNQAKVVASPGGGVILDSGENATVHLDPGNSCITEFADRKETVTVPFVAEHDHNGVTASTKYKWRTTADNLSWDRDMARDRNDNLDVGPSVTAEIGPVPDVLKVQYKTPGGVVLTDIEIGIAGGITINTGPGGLGQIAVDPAGRLKLGSKAIDLLDLVDQILTQLSIATTPTIFGISPLTNGTAFLPIKALLQTIKG